MGHLGVLWIMGHLGERGDGGLGVSSRGGGARGAGYSVEGETTGIVMGHVWEVRGGSREQSETGDEQRGQ